MQKQNLNALQKIYKQFSTWNVMDDDFTRAYLVLTETPEQTMPYHYQTVIYDNFRNLEMTTFDYDKFKRFIMCTQGPYIPEAIWKNEDNV